MSQEKSIYNMKLHEVFDDDNTTIIRVPGGWIYNLWFTDGIEREIHNSLFIPYNTEFHPTTLKMKAQEEEYMRQYEAQSKKMREGE